MARDRSESESADSSLPIAASKRKRTLRRTIQALNSEHFYGVMEQSPEPPAEMTIEAALGKLATTLAEANRLEQEAAQLVEFAREQGVSWTRIAEAAGIRRQSATQRWSDTGKEKHREAQRRWREASNTS